MQANSDSDRIERFLKRCVVKRGDAMTQMKTLYELALTVESNPDVAPIFCARKRDIETLVTEFNVEHNSVLDNLLLLSREDEFTDSHLSFKTKFMEQYYYIIALGTRLQLDPRPPVMEPPKSNVKHLTLPTIKLPMFDGDLLKWRTYRDTFTSLVHNNPDVSKIEKFHHLLSSTTGTAGGVLRSLSLTEDNYDIVWDNLHTIYDNKRVLVTAHLDAIFHFAPLVKESLSSLKSFLSTFQENVAAIKALDVEDLEGLLLFYIASRALDPCTRRLFESEYHYVDTPTLNLLLEFVQIRCQVLQNINAHPIKPSPYKSGTSKSLLFASSSTGAKLCKLCQDTHLLHQCSKFAQYSVQQRFDFAKSKRLCMNCLSPTHKTSECSSKHSCRDCSGKHHSLLHLNQRPKKTSALTSTSVAPEPASTVITAPGTSTSIGVERPFVGTFQSSGNVILGTAIIHVCNNIGEWTPVRALLDTGSQISVITHACASRLGLRRRHCSTSVMGLSQAHVPATKGSTHLTFKPRHANNPQISCDPLILSKITGPMPASQLSRDIRDTYNHVELADPEFDNPAPIEFLLGADVYANILGDCVRVLHAHGFPSAFETSLGWVIIGHTTAPDPSPCVSLLLSTQPSLDHLMHQFWSIEEPSPPVQPFTDDQKCEVLFTQTTSRDDQGRFSLALPFKSSPSILGDSYKMATSRFYNLEHKLQRDPDLYAQYRDFMKEYEALGHMVISKQPGKYYIPHHAVVKRNGINTKLRVVFDASAASTSNYSLNDLLYTGPKLQNDIAQILHRCRLKRYMVTANICKMYRQIRIHLDDRTYQHIVWRNCPSDELQDYELTTVTYGVSASPYQAIRVLHQLEREDGHKFPSAQNILSTQTYVDDIVSGDDTISALLQRQADLVQLLMQAGFELKKWSSNSREILRQIPQGDHAVQSSFDPKDDMSIKILGLHWDPVTDTFSYHTSSMPVTMTKRVVLSTIAKLYDPVGALAPIIFWAKSFMQTIWQSGLNWDDPLPPSLMTSWGKFASELHLVREIKLPRHIAVSPNCVTQLLGFCDASERGYAAVVYLRTIDVNGQIKLYFITSKSKVAPLKLGKLDHSLTIPRLELCGALLLAQTIQRLCETFENYISISAVYTWTDSQVVLSWLTSTPSQFKIFVTNRLAKISSLMPPCRWRYIPSALNPADCVSRGLFPSETVNHSLYWHGPPFVCLVESEWPTETYELIPPAGLPDYKPLDAVTCNVTSLQSPAWYLRFSSLTRMQRVTAYVQRFITIIKHLPTSVGPLQRSELEQALVPIIIDTQRTCLAALVSQLNVDDPKISPRSMAQLAPFIDQTGIIRVGGRLTHARSRMVAQCPILLPKVSHFTTLVIRHYHLTYLHAGPQLIASLLARTYWVISGRSAIRQLVFKCTVCARHKPRIPQPFMADLPPQRVRQSRPFSHVGVDFAGPLLIKDGRRRNSPSAKCYLAVFICMSIKAIHVEVVSDLSTNSFIASLHRFVSRRGVPSDIYSDCGTNFIGADKELRKLFRTSAAQHSVSDAIPCRWHFNPPAAPHFGGLWEAAVKSVKFHLKRVVGTQILTFEELTTLASRIEAVLNSRPLTAMSSDPHDLRALTPGDFLIGQPLTAIPEPDQTHIAQNRMNRWELLRQIYQSFWTRWASEYLTTLQGRSKWVQHQPNVKVGDLVLVQTPNQPPLFWKLGRIENTHPGQDGVVRVATVRTSDGSMKRPVVKLAVLPMEESSTSST